MPPSGSSSEQPDKARAEEELRALADRLQDHLLLVSAMLLEAGEEILAHMGFSAAHWRQNSSTNLLERLSKEIKRRSRVVGIFPDRSSIIRLVGAVLAEQHDEWQVARRYMSQESLPKAMEPSVIPADLEEEVVPLLMAS